MAPELRPFAQPGRAWAAGLRLLLLWGLLVSACAGGPDPKDDLADRGPPDLSRLDPGGGAPAIVVLLSVSGLAPSHYGTGGPMPVLAGLARAGISADSVERVSPATAYPVHTTLVTGQRPARHGVTADHLLGEHGPRVERYTHASLVQGGTLWQALEQRGDTVLSLDWPATVGAGIALLVPDLVASPGRRFRDLLQGTTSPALLEMAARSDVDLSVPSQDRDAFLVTAACRVLASPKPPRLVQMRLTQTWEAMALHGPGSVEAASALGRADVAIGRLLRCLADTGRLQSSAWVVVGDGDWQPVHSEVRPNRWLGEAGLVTRASGKGALLASWRAVLRSNGGSAFLYANDTEAALEARRLLSARAEETGAFRVIRAEEMIALHADPEAWFGLAASPGYVLSDSLDEPTLGPARLRGVSGYLGEAVGGPSPRAEAGPGLVLYGRGLRRGVRAPRLRLVDVAPTLAVLLGVALPEAEGQAQLGLLRPIGDPLASGRGGASGRWLVEVNP